MNFGAVLCRPWRDGVVYNMDRCSNQEIPRCRSGDCRIFALNDRFLSRVGFLKLWIGKLVSGKAYTINLENGKPAPVTPKKSLPQLNRGRLFTGNLLNNNLVIRQPPDYSHPAFSSCWQPGATGSGTVRVLPDHSETWHAPPG